MKWTLPEYVKILTDAYPRYRDANADDQEDIVAEVRRDIKEARKDNYIGAPPGLTKVNFKRYLLKDDLLMSN